jgi:hypothetical protein
MLHLQKIRELSFFPSNHFFSMLVQDGLGCDERVFVMPMENVFVLQPKDKIRHDAEPISTIYRNLDTASADQVVTRALGELALTMAGLADQVRAHDLTDVQRQVRRLQRMAENLGMLSFSSVCGDVRACLEEGNVTAFGAVWARLLRVAERSFAPEKNWIGLHQI